MSRADYHPERTALLFVDPYNDFLSDGGKLWPHVAQVAGEVDLLENLRRVLAAARDAGLTIVVVPHHRSEPRDLADWDHPTPYQLGASRAQVFARGDWGGEWRAEFAPRAGELVCKEHWGASGFANTDLDFLLKQRGIRDVVLIGLLANTCIEGTARFAVELGYRVTLVRDATAAFDAERMRAAHELNGPTFAHAILTTSELASALASVAPATQRALR